MRRRLTALNAAAALLLALALVVALNLLAARHPWRRELTGAPAYALSAETIALLQKLPADLEITLFAGAGDELAREVRELLREYEAAARRVRVSLVDPHRDLARSKVLALRYDVRTPGVAVLACGDRRKIVSLSDMAEYDLQPLLAGQPKLLTAFRGEQVFSSAIQDLLQERTPVVYFLAGHGERQISSYDQTLGYSLVARQLQRNNLEVRTLNLGRTPALPRDCDLLVIAGPTQPLNRDEITLLKDYLEASGRLLLLLDAGVDSGLDGLLEAWGLGLAADRVVGLTLTGRELLVNDYGRHPITERLAADQAVTVFHEPRSIRPLAGVPGGRASADKPRLTVLAAGSDKSWAEMSPQQNPPRLDPGVDRPGPVPVAVAVERGALREMDVALKPSRLVVVGDTAFVANGALLAGYSPAFLLNAVNWLLERPGHVPIPARSPARLRVIMDQGRWRLLCGLLIGALPALAAVAGLLAWLRR